MGGECALTGLEKEVLSLIKPKEWERAKASMIVESVTSILRETLAGAGIEADVTVEGSYAKDTWLSGELDIDIFILLKRSECIKLIEEGIVTDLVKKSLGKLYEIEERYAAHPYVRVRVEDVWVEVVPGCRISWGEKPLTPVDRTPLHRQYINSKLNARQKDEVRLLKKFMKGIGVYGAELGVQGFSGYLAELLIVAYKCFRRVLDAATGWKPPVVVDIEGYWELQRKELIRRHRGNPLIVVDPVDPDRNAAAAVSMRSLGRLVLAANLYLSRPTKHFFFQPKPCRRNLEENLRMLGGRLVAVKLEPLEQLPPEQLWGQAKRLAANAAAELARHGFTVVHSAVVADEARLEVLVLVEVLEEELPPQRLQRGPPPWMREHSIRFAEKTLKSQLPAIWVSDDGRLYSLRPRKATRPLDALKAETSTWIPQKIRKSYRVAVLENISDVMNFYAHLSESEKNRLLEAIIKTPHWIDIRPYMCSVESG